MSDSQGVERRGWEDELNAAWALVDVWRGRFEDAAARETALHAEVESLKACKSLAQWLASMDEPESSARRTVTLTGIIDAASAALDPSKSGLPASAEPESAERSPNHA